MTLCAADGTPLWSYDTQSFNPRFDYWVDNGVVTVEVRDRDNWNIVERDAVQPSGATHPLVGSEYVDDTADNGWYVTYNWETGESFLFNDQGDLVYRPNSGIELADNGAFLIHDPNNWGQVLTTHHKHRVRAARTRPTPW